MPLTPGQTLTHFEILGPLGAGGMGEVYRARDTRLEREVAIKVLPDELADDDDRLRRFEREAKTLASLSHANLAHVYGIDQVGDTCFIAMELVPGEDLEARLRRGALALDEAVEVCRQIAEGLEAAHEAGVVHRDLKPANVRITPEGVVKLLDFGLAKPIGPGGAEGVTTSARGDSFLVTSEGMILGTPTYMSPEQARGREVDKRTDIWAFGCVLYECLTGRRAFEGEAFGDLIAAILEREADLAALPGTTPPRVRELVARCLVKDPRRRLRDIGEARLTLEATGEAAPAADGTPRGDEVRRRRTAFVGWIVVTGIAGVAGWRLGRRDHTPAASWSHFTQVTDTMGAETGPSISPDGDSIAYSSNIAGGWDVYVHRVGGRNPVAVAADPERDEMWPAFSPDGSRIAYHESDRDGGVWTTGATGEATRRLTDFGFHPTWSPGGERIAFVTEEALNPYSRDGINSNLWVVPATGGAPVQWTETDAMQPAWSPSGSRIAVWLTIGGQRDLATYPAGGGEPFVLLDDPPLDWAPTWSPDGESLYFASDRGGSMGLWRLPIDERSGRALGAPEPVVGGLEVSVALPSLSRDGRVLAFRSEALTVNPVAIPFDPETEVAGRPRELLRRSGILRPYSVSSDGEWLALTNMGELREDLFLMRTDGSGLRRVTDDEARDRNPRFSPDDTRITFMSNRSGRYEGYSIRPDGSALTMLTEDSPVGVSAVTLEPSGERIVAAAFDGTFVIAGPPWPLHFEKQADPVVEVPGGSLSPRLWSPDGRRLSATILEPLGGGPCGIGVYDVASRKGRQLTDDRGLLIAPWLPDGNRILYFTLDEELVVVDVDTAERRVIDVELPFPAGTNPVAVSPDGTTLYYGAERTESNIWIVERGR